METKEEVKKAILTEPLKFGIQTLLIFIGANIFGAIAYIRDVGWDEIPKWILFVFNFLFFSLVIGLLLRLRRTRKQLAEVRETAIVQEPEIQDAPPSIAPKIFEPNEIETKILLFVFRSTRTAQQEDIFGHLNLQHAQEAEFYLRNLVENNYLKPPPSFPIEARLNSGYKLTQKARSYVIDNILAASNG